MNKNNDSFLSAMKVALVARNGTLDQKDVEHVKVAGLEIVETHPDVVLSYGGEGIFLQAEKNYPGVPKLLVDNNKICNKCTKHTIEDWMYAIRTNTFKVENYIKIKAKIGEKRLLAVKEIVLRNKLPTHALRFELNLGGESFEEGFVGDGIVVATPFGAHGYFYSIARTVFNIGLGLAFNNLTRDISHFNFEDEKSIEIKVTRGEAVLTADNNPDAIEIKEGDSILIKKAEEKAQIMSLH